MYTSSFHSPSLLTKVFAEWTFSLKLFILLRNGLLELWSADDVGAAIHGTGKQDWDGVHGC